MQVFTVLRVAEHVSILWGNVVIICYWNLTLLCLYLASQFPFKFVSTLFLNPCPNREQFSHENMYHKYLVLLTRGAQSSPQIWTITGCLTNMYFFLIFLLTFFPIQPLPPLPITVKWSQFVEILSNGVQKYSVQLTRPQLSEKKIKMSFVWKITSYNDTYKSVKTYPSWLSRRIFGCCCSQQSHHQSQFNINSHL